MENLDIEFLKKNGKLWVQSQRNALRGAANALSIAEKQILGTHFTQETLNTVRILKVAQIENPEFYKKYVLAGITIPIDFRHMVGIAFIDTVVMAEPKIAIKDWFSFLFHECVHVCQYQLLGLDNFIEEYVNSLAQNNGEYLQISLEIDAYDLQELFNISPNIPLDVETQVRRKLHKRGNLER